MRLTEEAIRKEPDLAAIKDWMKKQPHLPDEWEDSFLLTFLRGCKFSLEKTKKKIDMYFTMRAACPEFFANRDITLPDLEELVEKARLPTMPGLTPDGRTLTIAKGLDNSMEANRLADAMKILFMEVDLRLREQTEEVTGEIYILDASVVRPSHLGTISLSMLKKFFICVQEAYPVRVKDVHVVNGGALVDAMFNISKPFLTEKLKRRIHFHKDYSTLLDHVPKNMLPKDYGGTGCTLLEAHQAWMEKLKENRSWLKEQETIKANEALRPGKPTNYSDLFGVDGSFRQLSID